MRGHVQLTFLGVRGSLPVSSPNVARYGGNSTCIAVSTSADAPPTLLLDAGSGLAKASRLLDGEPYVGSILLSHLHWDHVMGVPFFFAGDRANSRVDMFLPAQDGRDGLALMSQFMSPPAFPITPEGLAGDWTFSAVEPGTFETDGFQVTATEITHKGGRTYGYRIEREGASIGFAPDHAPALGVSAHTIETLAEVDVLVHDAQFLEAERDRADSFGHATVADAVAFAEEVQARHLVLFHHGPFRSDDALDHIIDEADTFIPVTIAREGMILSVGA
jgi:ribonuclease BN (tRNA processing enzyme)